jgi:hypothetical protein
MGTSFEVTKLSKMEAEDILRRILTAPTEQHEAWGAGAKGPTHLRSDGRPLEGVYYLRSIARTDQERSDAIRTALNTDHTPDEYIEVEIMLPSA